MKVHYDLENLPDFKDAVVTIGSFDGVHAAHRIILDKVRQLAISTGGESVVITFHPHPRLVVFPKDDSLELINTLDEKADLLNKSGIDHLVIAPFSVQFSQLKADEYIENFLVKRFKPKHVVIGYDHRFGLSREGDINYLRWYSKKAGFEIDEIPKQETEQVKISSTLVRKAIGEGRMEEANELLGYAFPLSGKVVHGFKVGQILGYPTANIKIKESHKIIPGDGAYAVLVDHVSGQYEGMLYIGSRPTVDGVNGRSIEVHIFDFAQEIYGEDISMKVLSFLRRSTRFNSKEELKEQLHKDETKAKTIIKTFLQTKTLPQIALVILNYNTKTQLERFLPTVLNSNYNNLRVILADNGSTDGAIQFVEENFPNVEILDLENNHGFAGGYNQALQKVNAPYYLLLNSDVEVAPGWVDPLLEAMEKDKDIAAVQPKIKSLYQRDEFEYAGGSGGWLDFLGYPFCRGRIFDTVEKDKGQYDDVSEIFWATGAAMLIRSELFHKFGGFDADYFAHSEEIDLCWRLKRAGYKIMCVPESEVFHLGGGTLQYDSPRKAYLNFRNNLITIFKNESALKLSWLLLLRLVLDGVAAMMFLSQGKFKHIIAVLRAHFAFYKRLPKLYKKRKKAQVLIGKFRINDQGNTAGRYKGSVVWKFYIEGKKHFSQLWK